jgi:hypothetical protein
MCGKCESIIWKLGDISVGLGMLLILLAAVSRLTGWTPCQTGPYSFAAGAALFLLLSTAIHTCKSTCHPEGPKT